MFAPSAFVQLLQLPKRPLNIEFVVVVVGKLAHLLGQRGIQQMCVCVCTPAGPMPSPCDSMCVCFGANQQIHIKFIFTIAIHNQRHFKLNHSYSLTPTWPRPFFCFSPIPPCKPLKQTKHIEFHMRHKFSTCYRHQRRLSAHQEGELEGAEGSEKNFERVD